MIEIHQKMFKLLLTPVFKLTKQCLQQRISAVYRVPANQQPLQLEIHREVVPYIKVQGLLTVVEDLQTAYSVQLIHMELYAHGGLQTLVLERWLPWLWRLLRFGCFWTCAREKPKRGLGLKGSTGS
jgi:hypothetical protein